MKDFTSKWWWTLVGLLTLTIILVFSWEFFLSNGIKILMSHILSNQTGRELVVDGVYREKEYWVIDSPRFVQRAPNESQFMAEHAKLSYTIDLWNGEINLYVTLENPEFIFSQPDSFFSNDESLERKKGLFNIYTHFACDNGCLRLGEQEYNVHGKLSMDFSSYEGNLQVGFTGGREEDSSLFLGFSKDLDSTQLHFQCKDLECFHIQHASCYLCPEIKSLKIHHGTLNGNGGFILKPHQRPLFYGEASLSNINFEYPSFNVNGVFTEVRFHLKMHPEKPVSYGSIIFCGDESLVFDSFNSHISQLKNIMGGVYVDEESHAKIVLEGLFDNSSNEKQWSLEGEGFYPLQGKPRLNLNWTLKNSSDDSKGQLKLWESSEQCYEAEVNLSQGSFQDTQALQILLQKLFADYSPIQLTEGIFDLQAKAFIRQGKLEKFAFNHFDIHQLHGIYDPFSVSFKIEKLSGKALLDLIANATSDETMVQLEMTGGKINVKSEGEGVQDIHAHLNIIQGDFIDSYAEGRWKNLLGRLDIHPKGSSEIKLLVNGQLKDAFLCFENDYWREKLATIFIQHAINISADISGLDQGVKIEGNAQILDENSTERPVSFGFDLVKAQKTGISDLSEDFETLQNLLPTTAVSLIYFEKQFFKDNPFFGYEITHGWFDTAEMPLEKYIAPFVVDQAYTKLEGIGRFHGRFDQTHLITTYETGNVILENGSFKIEAIEIGLDPLTRYMPLHAINFASGVHFGILPLRNATYYEKCSGLIFTDIHTDVIFEEKNTHASCIETFCQGIYFEGSLAVDMNNFHQGCLDLDIRMESMHGKLTQVQNMFSHVQPDLFFLKLPMEGDVTMHQDAGCLQFNFSPGGYSTRAYLKGALSEGHMVSHDSNVSLQSLSLTFDYDHQTKILDFYDIQGTLLVGKPEKAEEYILIGEKIHFSDYSRNHALFDLWIGDKKRDVIRIAGETFSSVSYPGENCVQVLLDQNLSHFGNVYPQTFHLILKDWWKIQEFQLESEFNLANIFQDLQRFSRTGFLFLSPHSLKKLNEIDQAEGSFKINLEYSDYHSRLNYHIAGQNVRFDEHAFKTVALQGKKLDDVWIIDQLALDDISMAADILRKPKSWVINFLGVQLKDSVLIGLQGEYLEDLHEINGKINLLEVNLESLKKWSKLSSIWNKFPLKGNLRASGTFHCPCDDVKASLDMSLKASLKNGEFKGLSFGDITQASIEFSPEKGLLVQNIETNFKIDALKKAHLNLEKMKYDVRQDIFSLDNFQFSIPSYHVREILNILAKSFPTLFSATTIEMLSQTKKSSNLEGSLNVDYADPHYALQLVLKDGEYHLFDKKFIFSNVLMEYDPCEMTATVQCHNYATPFWMQYKTSSIEGGEVIFSENAPDALPENPLMVQWKKQGDGFFVEHARGQFHGMFFNLTSNRAATECKGLSLEGEIHVDVKKAGVFLASELGTKMADWMGSGFCVKGLWNCYPGMENNELVKMYFTGRLEGQNFEFNGYQFDRLYADMEGSPQCVSFKNLYISDPCGNFYIDQAQIQPNKENKWTMSIAKAEVHEFTPSLLRKVGVASTTSSPKPLIIRELYLEKGQGILGDSSSFIGQGSLEFSNPPKKNIPHPLFAIPSEIISRLGLDLSTLTPVIGTLFYEIKDQKIILTKLKESYSQGKTSKFYLAASPESYIDFDGNLHVQIKMKQSNVFFKLAELFTVTVQGTWQKPSYTLQKQKK